MPDARRILAVTGALASLALAGCYGSTEPATNIGTRGATLHGKGTTGKDGTHVFFEYWPTQYPANRASTFGHNIPGDVSGPYNEDSVGPSDVQPDTDYSFRLCGQDTGASSATCAQTRTFRSLRPSGDLVSGTVTEFNGSQTGQDIVDARSDPSGAHPTGKLTLYGQEAWTVTCVRVSGNTAAVGASGPYQTGTGTVPATVLYVIVDGGAAGGPGQDRMKFTVKTNSTTPPDCAAATFQNLAPLGFSTVAVFDAP